MHAEDQARLVHVGPGKPAGEWLRRYWQPACLSSEVPERDGPPVRVRLLGEDLIAFRDTQRARRPGRRVLPASPRAAVLRPQRGMRPALRLSRLEVRRRRRLRRYAERAGRQPDEERHQDQGLSDGRARRRGLGLYGPARTRCRAPPDYEWTRAPETHRHVSKTYRGMQLPAGPRRRARHRACQLPAQQQHRRYKQSLSRATARRRSTCETTDYGYYYISTRADRRRTATGCASTNTSCRSSRCGRACVSPVPGAQPHRAANSTGISGCRSMTSTPWSTIGRCGYDQDAPLDPEGFEHASSAASGRGQR